MRRLQYLVLFAFAIILTACGNEPKTSSILNTLPTPLPTAELLIAPAAMATPTKWMSPLSATTMAIYGPKLTEIAVVPPVTNPIKIDGVTFGQYGKNVTWSLGPDGSITNIGYFVPSGNYRAVNNMPVRDQVNVYSPETVIQDGYEYAADGRNYLVESGGSIDIYVPFGWYVKVAPQSVFTLSPLWYTSEAVSTPVAESSAIESSGYHMPRNIYSPTPKPTDKPCYVKGNPDSMIYHCPGSPNYNDLIGYRCFSSSAEAEAAGYRPAKNMSGCPY